MQKTNANSFREKECNQNLMHNNDYYEHYFVLFAIFIFFFLKEDEDTNQVSSDSE